MTTTGCVDNKHLLHHLLVGQIGVPLGDSRIVKRDEGQAMSAKIKPTKIADLGSAEIALAVVNHDISVI
jgi:hypothetical protein